MDASPNSDSSRRLRTLLREADIATTRLATASRIAMYMGRTREWALLFRLNDDWLTIRSFVCRLPTESSLRTRLLEHALGLNGKLSLVKFASDGTNLTLDVEYRTEHLDATVLGNVAGLAYGTLEQQYPAIFRIVTGDAVLEQLDYTQHGEAA